MNNSEFKAVVPAKWVLSGEHTVLRGGAAIAFPCWEYTLSLTYSTEKPSSAQLAPEIKSLIQKAFSYLSASCTDFRWDAFEFSSQIPMGAGLGSSAALCVAVARFALWKTGKKTNTEKACIELATHLEDSFHGKSSGMDVAVVAMEKPIVYTRKWGGVPLDLPRLPRFKLIDTQQRGMTRECVARVQSWVAEHSVDGAAMDAQMMNAGELAQAALQEYLENPIEAEKKLIQSMELSQGCFEAWGLMNPALTVQRQEILRSGALAARLTGAGMGGFWLCLMPSVEPS